MPLDPQFKVTRSQKGIIEHAEALIAGVTHALICKTGIANWRAFSATEFHEDRICYLRVRCTMSVPQEVLSLSTDDNGKKSELHFDFSRYNATHDVFVTGSNDGAKVSGVFDPRTNKWSGDNVSMEALLTRTTVARLEKMIPVFEEAKKTFDGLRKPFEPVIQQTIHNSFWGSVGRAACWGTGGVCTAVVCAGTIGAACLCGAFCVGALASECSDHCPT
jgi:hypothetical protein